MISILATIASKAMKRVLSHHLSSFVSHFPLMLIAAVVMSTLNFFFSYYRISQCFSYNIRITNLIRALSVRCVAGAYTPPVEIEPSLKLLTRGY